MSSLTSVSLDTLRDISNHLSASDIFLLELSGNKTLRLKLKSAVEKFELTRRGGDLFPTVALTAYPNLRSIGIIADLPYMNKISPLFRPGHTMCPSIPMLNLQSLTYVFFQSFRLLECDLGTLLPNLTHLQLEGESDSVDSTILQRLPPKLLTLRLFHKRTKAIQSPASYLKQLPPNLEELSLTLFQFDLLELADSDFPILTSLTKLCLPCLNIGKLLSHLPPRLKHLSLSGNSFDISVRVSNLPPTLEELRFRMNVYVNWTYDAPFPPSLHLIEPMSIMDDKLPNTLSQVSDDGIDLLNKRDLCKGFPNLRSLSLVGTAPPSGEIALANLHNLPSRLTSLTLRKLPKIQQWSFKSLPETLRHAKLFLRCAQDVEDLPRQLHHLTLMRAHTRLHSKSMANLPPALQILSISLLQFEDGGLFVNHLPRGLTRLDTGSWSIERLEACNANNVQWPPSLKSLNISGLGASDGNFKTIERRTLLSFLRQLPLLETLYFTMFGVTLKHDPEGWNHLLSTRLESLSIHLAEYEATSLLGLPNSLRILYATADICEQDAKENSNHDEVFQHLPPRLECLIVPNGRYLTPRFFDFIPKNVHKVECGAKDSEDSNIELMDEYNQSRAKYFG